MKILADVTARTCEMYRRAISSDEEPSDIVGYLAQMDGVQRPAIWRRLRTGGVLPPYNNDRTRVGRKAAGISPATAGRIDERTLPPRVDRDPCERCGTRHDIGCHHSRAPVGMTF